MASEVESRYMVPSRTLFQRLTKLEALGKYAIQPRGTIKVIDYYLDTKGRALLHQGWAGRLRSQGATWTLTLKGPKSLQGAVVSRPEWEILLQERVEDVAGWPRGPIRDQVEKLTGGLPLRQLLSIRQTRHRSLLLSGSRQVAELSLDVVRVLADGVRRRSYMLECELLAQGQMDDLERLDDLFVNTYQLVPETRSKLRRALESIELGSSADSSLVEDSREVTVETLCELYQVDLHQANRVAQFADLLYDRLWPAHRLTASLRPVLRVASLLHNVGEAIHRAQRHIVGRDILLRHPIAGLDEGARCIVAAAAYLHRKRMAPARIAEALPEPLSPHAQREALTVAALVRLASALDSTATPSSLIQGVDFDDDRVRIVLSGPNTDAIARRAQARSDLWTMLFGTMLDWQTQRSLEQEDETGQAQASRKGELGVLPSDSMAQAASKVLQFHFQRMLRHEPGTRLGEDPEELHDMRVAIRRLRSALQMFRFYLDGRRVQALADGLRQPARVLGSVRDMDVALAAAREYLANLSSPQPEPLDPLLAEWQCRREKARQCMITHLDASAYRELVGSLSGFIEDPRSGRGNSVGDSPVARLVPQLLYVRSQMVYAYDPVLEDAPIGLLHALRIDCKRLRYGLEFFREILPPAATKVISHVVAVQDHLGNLHDADVAVHMLDEFISREEESQGLAGVEAYRATRCEERSQLRDSFPSAWRRFSRPKVRRSLSQSLLPP